MFKKSLSLFIIICFFLTTLGPMPQAHADTLLGLPEPGTMVNLSAAYQPALIKGLTVNKDNPFLFDFIMDTGHSGLKGDALKKEGDRLVKYFFACLTIPDKDLWVNLSPYEKDRMVPQALGQTALGRDLLAEDYILKQLTASLIYPEKNLGREFWDRVYSKARKMYGTTQIPVNTFNKVWILADKATVYEHNQTAFVLDGHLKVMLEEDYLSLVKHNVETPFMASHERDAINRVSTRNNINALGGQIVRQIILPELENEVNTGKNFATLRQIFNSLILASWYKKSLKQALLNQIYADKNTINGIERSGSVIASAAKRSQQELSPDQIYQQYIKAYKKGVFNYIKEDPQSDGQTIPRKYFSGGFGVAQSMLTVDYAQTSGSSSKLSNAFRALSAGIVSILVLAGCTSPYSPDKISLDYNPNPYNNHPTNSLERYPGNPNNYRYNAGIKIPSQTHLLPAPPYKRTPNQAMKVEQLKPLVAGLNDFLRVNLVKNSDNGPSFDLYRIVLEEGLQWKFEVYKDGGFNVKRKSESFTLKIDAKKIESVDDLIETVWGVVKAYSNFPDIDEVLKKQLIEVVGVNRAMNVPDDLVRHANSSSDIILPWNMRFRATEDGGIFYTRNASEVNAFLNLEKTIKSLPYMKDISVISSNGALVLSHPGKIRGPVALKTSVFKITGDTLKIDDSIKIMIDGRYETQRSEASIAAGGGISIITPEGKKVIDHLPHHFFIAGFKFSNGEWSLLFTPQAFDAIPGEYRVKTDDGVITMIAGTRVERATEAMSVSDGIKQKAASTESKARYSKMDNVINGGIDLTNVPSGIVVARDAQGGVMINADPAMVARFRKYGVESVDPMIIRVSFMSPADIGPLLGVH